MTSAIHILVADDDDNDLSMTLAALNDCDDAPKIASVHDGVEVLDFLHSRGAYQSRTPGNPQVLLLDLNMPRVDGWEVLRQMKADAMLRTIPVVVFTSSQRERDVRASYELGANAYVVKPIDFSEFTDTIRDIRTFWVARNLPPPENTGPAFSVMI